MTQTTDRTSTRIPHLAYDVMAAGLIVFSLHVLITAYGVDYGAMWAFVDGSIIGTLMVASFVLLIAHSVWSLFVSLRHFAYRLRG
jgi:hypothetical protein